MNRNLNRRIHPIAEADGLSPKKPRKALASEFIDKSLTERIKVVKKRLKLVNFETESTA